MADTATPRTGAARDWWPWGLAAAHLLHTLWFAAVYPEFSDPDLVAYFVYWKNLVTGRQSLHDASYFTVPKRCCLPARTARQRAARVRREPRRRRALRWST
jgi:hypothetical protein